MRRCLNPHLKNIASVMSTLSVVESCRLLSVICRPVTSVTTFRRPVMSYRTQQPPSDLSSPTLLLCCFEPLKLSSSPIIGRDKTVIRKRGRQPRNFNGSGSEAPAAPRLAGFVYSAAPLPRPHAPRHPAGPQKTKKPKHD